MNAYAITGAGLAAVLAEATQPTRKLVEDMDTGETVGWIVDHGTYVEWGSGDASGTVQKRAQALARIAEEVTGRRDAAEREAAYEAEITALPEPLRTLRIERDRAALNHEIERRRIPHRLHDVALTYDRLQAAEMAYAAAERQMAEAA